MVDHLIASLGGLDEDAQLGLHASLAHVVVELLGAQIGLGIAVIRGFIGAHRTTRSTSSGTNARRTSSRKATADTRTRKAACWAGKRRRCAARSRKGCGFEAQALDRRNASPTELIELRHVAPFLSYGSQTLQSILQQGAFIGRFRCAFHSGAHLSRGKAHRDQRFYDAGRNGSGDQLRIALGKRKLFG